MVFMICAPSARKRVEPGMSVKQIRQIKHVPYVPDNLLDNFKSFCNGFLGKKPVTRSNLLAVFISCGKSHFGGSCSGYYYSFSLNKLSFGDSYSDYYAFDDWLNFYDSRIGFEPDPDGDSSCDVATDDKMTIDDYQKYKGVVLSNKIKSAGSLETVALDIYDDSGARIQSLQADVLLNSAGALVVRLVKQ